MAPTANTAMKGLITLFSLAGALALTLLAVKTVDWLGESPVTQATVGGVIGIGIFAALIWALDGTVAE